MGQIKAFTPKLKFSKGMVWYFAIFHALALLAFFPFAFSWSAVVVMLVLNWMTASLGICLGFHRYLTHRSLDLPKWLGYFFVLLGSLALENGPIKWVGQHRMHHANSDTDQDPHSARKGFWWAHWGWMLHRHPEFDNPFRIKSYTKDLQDDAFYVFLEKHFISVQVAFGLILFAIGGIPWVIWGIFLRVVLVYHQTWLVNSAAHTFGYKNVKLKNDLSTNCWWVGLLAFGEGWHNNHHAFPKSARHGLRPWEVDMTWWTISVLKTLGLATNIQVARLYPNRNNKYFTGEVVKGEAVKSAAA